MTDLEKLILSGFDFNDQVKTSLESLTFIPAQPKAKWADNPNADGAALVEEPQYTQSYFEIQVRIIPAEDTDAALEVIGEILDALQTAPRVEGGAECLWTPAASSRTYSAYTQLAELADLPIEPTGELAGWFIASPVLKIKLTNRPFLYTSERQVLTTTASSEPIQVVYVGGIKGDVPAEARMKLTDKASRARRYVEWGQDIVESEEGNPWVQFSMVFGVLAGTSSTKTGSHSTNVVKGVLTQTAVVLCQTGIIDHIGAFKGKLRCQQLAAGGLFRLAYRTGNGSWTKLKWTSLPQIEGWVEIDLGELLLEEAEVGDQVSEIRIEGKAEAGAAKLTAYIDLLSLMPARRYAVARAPFSFGDITSPLVSDGFDQAEGNATGKEADIGGVYAALTNSAATDFTISNGKLRRTSVSDAGNIGSLPIKGRAIGTPVEAESIAMRSSFSLTGAGVLSCRFGHVLGWSSTTSMIIAFLYYHNDIFGTGWEAALWVPNVGGGSITYTPAEPIPTLRTAEPAGTMITVVSGTTASIYIETADLSLTKLFSVTHANIGKKGKLALIDENPSASAATRLYDDVTVWVPETSPVVCPSNQTVEINSQEAIRGDSGGNFWSPVPIYRGADFYLEPAGQDAVINRIANKARRNDLKLETDEGITDNRAIEIFARERFLAPR